MVQTILESAARILETQGFAAYNTNEIALRAGVSVGSLYQYFPNKDAITSALIAREMAALSQAITDIAAIASDRERLLRLVEIAVDHQLRRPALARLLDIEEERLPSSREVARMRGQLVGIIRNYVDAVRAPGRDRNDHATEDVVAIIKGMVDAAGQRGETDAELLVGRVARAVFGCLFEAPTLS
jgi:AcrR family transcriptional regulator